MAIEILFYNKTAEDVEIYEGVITDIIKEAYQYENLKGECLVNFIFLNNSEIKEMNHSYRGKDYATDVLTFENEDELGMGVKRHLGDVFISVEKMIEQAYEFGHGEVREMAFLAVHGFLHLLGYDHLDEVSEKEMFSKQEDILNAKNIRR